MKRTLPLMALVIFSSGALVFGAEPNPPANATPKTEPTLPRYKLEVGQELVYDGDSRFEYERGSHGTKERTTFWVTRLNADGSWHVVAHQESTFWQSHGKDQKTTMPGRKEDSLGGFDVFPDGRIAHPPESFENRGLMALFYKLPVSIAEAQGSWETEKEGDKSIYRVGSNSDAASGKWILEKTEQSPLNEIYLSTSKARVSFDGGRGLVTKVESESAQKYGIDGKGNGLIELKSATKKPSDWVTQLQQEADILAHADADVSAGIEQIRKGAQAKEVGERAEKILRDAGQKVTLPVVQAQIQAELQRLKGNIDYLAQDKEKEAGILNQPAANWETTEVDGNKRALSDFRGKVVVLDFWYRGCGWCIRAMPQIKDVAEHFRDKPVAVLGMNTDRETKDARFVMDKLKLNYPTLKAEGLPEKYGVQGFPTLIIIDQKGVVRARYVGYSPTLSEEIIRTIDGLLAANP